MVQPARQDEPGPQLWPIFICYRQVDGLPAARRLYELLDKREVKGPNGELIRFDVYLDQTMAAVADWREIHRPYLEKARALIVICTPGAKIDEGPDDWVHKEIGWWLEHRDSVPILIDPLNKGVRYVPDAIHERWPEIQRIPLIEAEWSSVPAAALEEKAEALRRQIVGNILPGGAAIYQQELEAERTRARRLRIALGAAVVLFAVTALAGIYAFDSQRKAEISRRVSQASLYDAQAASYFDEARREEARYVAAKQAQSEKKRELSAIARNRSGLNALPSSAELANREQNLTYESKQLDETMKELSTRAETPRRLGYTQLKLADDGWKALQKDGHDQAKDSRRSPEPPHIFSVELIDAGGGESILVHYGPPDNTHLMMINSGPMHGYEGSVRRRLHELKMQRFNGAPTPIELFIASDQDEHKTGGLAKLLTEQTESEATTDRVVEFRRIWANMFAAFDFRGRIRGDMEKLGIPRNEPFDHLVARPDLGRLTFDGLPGGLEIIVLGPKLSNLKALYESSKESDELRLQEQRRPLATIFNAFPEERFTRLKVSEDGTLLSPPPLVESDGRCLPSENAVSRADVSATDESIPNLASTVLLFRYRGMTFLHTGDSRADLIQEALISSGLMKRDGRAHVNLLLLPHLGSNRNLTPEFLRKVTADQYLFSGNGTHDNPEIGTMAALIAARPCDRFVMHFVNRESTAINPSRLRRKGRVPGAAELETHGQRLEAFFAAENQSHPRYRRNFRSTDDGSVFIDLLDRLTY